MDKKEKDDLFYVCSLIEYLGRKTKNHRSTIVKILGKREIKRQLNLADVNHCLSFEHPSIVDTVYTYLYMNVYTYITTMSIPMIL